MSIAAQIKAHRNAAKIRRFAELLADGMTPYGAAASVGLGYRTGENYLHWLLELAHELGVATDGVRLSKDALAQVQEVLADIHPTTSEAAPVAPGAAPDPTKEI